MLARELKPGQTVVMDNASFHKSHLVREIIEAAGCKLVYLPPYSPDLNPIEKFWANLKRWINQHVPYMDDFHKAI
jgi:transposase